MSIEDRVKKLEEKIKAERESIAELSEKAKRRDTEIVKIRQLKQTELQLSNQLKGIEDQKKKLKEHLAKQEDAIKQEGGSIEEEKVKDEHNKS